MTPGQELDILIAEKVMGETVVKNKSGSKKGGFYFSLGEPIWFDLQGDMQLSNPVPAYSGNIADAWTLLDAIHAGSPAFETILQQDYEGLWSCSLSGASEGQSYLGQAMNASSAPHAICLAALGAVT